MTLQTNITRSAYGQEINIGSCSVKVETVFCTKHKVKAEVSFRVGSEDGEQIDKKSFAFDLDLNGGNPIKQTYEHLKTLPEFAGAADA